MEEIEISIGKNNKSFKFKYDVNGKIIEKESDAQKISIIGETKLDNQVDVIGHILSYKGNKVNIFYDDNNKPWLKCVNVTNILGYVGSDQTIRRLVSHENKITYGNLLKYNPKFGKGLKIEKNDASSFYLNIAGVFELLSKSKKKEAIKFQKWVNCEVLPSINDKGHFNMYDEVDDVIFEKNNNLHIDYVVNNSAYDICDVNTIYLGYIGSVKHISKKSNTSFKEGEICYKFGITTKGVTRAEQHKNIIDQYVMFHVKKCIDHIKLENALKFELKQKGLLRNCVFGKLNYTELFTVTDTFTIDDIIKFIDDWIDKNDYKYKNDSILLAEYTLKNNEEITKQKALDVEKLKLEIELLKLQNQTKNQCL